MSRARILLGLGIAVLFVACSDDGPTSLPEVPGPNADILDAVNGINGNPYVFLKPPVVPDPPSELFGVFNSALGPVLDVCRLDHPVEGDCEVLQTNDGTNLEAHYTLDGGPGGESITVDPVAEEYQLEIHFRLFDLIPDETYRIIVRLGSKELAYADLLVTSPQEMRNLDGGSNIIFTNDNKTLPWRFRIDQGALCWEPGETETACASATVEEGTETTVSLTSSDGEEVDLHLPSGWTATVGGASVGDLTLSIEEVPGDIPVDGDLSCFQNIVFGDPATGEPTNCYEVRADTESETDVEVQFGGSLPIFSFCPSQEVLQAMANGSDGWLISSAEEDDGNTTFMTYEQVQAPPDFGGCTLPPPDEVDALFGDGFLGRFASSVWRRVRPVVAPVLPRPLYAFDIGFGAKLPALTIFYWSRTPVDLAVSPAAPSLGVGETVQLSPDPIFHHADSDLSSLSSIYDVSWESNDASVATVDANGLVTGVAAGPATITATATNLWDDTSEQLEGSAEVTVTSGGVVLGGYGTATVDGILSPGEWDGALVISVAPPAADPTLTGIELYFMNDNGNLYSAVSFPYPIDLALDNRFFLDADNDNDGNGPEDGDDFWEYSFFNPSPGPVFTDYHRSEGGANIIPDDVDHGQGAFQFDGVQSVYELSHPLNSGEIGQDFALSPPTAVGILMGLIIDGIVVRQPVQVTFPTYMELQIFAPPVQ